MSSAFSTDKDGDNWMDVYQCPRDSWLKELESIVGKFTKEQAVSKETLGEQVLDILFVKVPLEIFLISLAMCCYQLYIRKPI